MRGTFCYLSILRGKMGEFDAVRCAPDPRVRPILSSRRESHLHPATGERQANGFVMSFLVTPAETSARTLRSGDMGGFSTAISANRD